MKRLLFFALLLTAIVPLAAQEADIPFIKAEQLTAWKNSDSDTVFVLNFWATWCAPCVAELPDFEKLHEEYAARKVKVILISNDFRRDVDTKLKSFVQRKALKSQVVFMDEKTPNKWIDLVSPEWSGALPATIIVSKSRGFEQFFEKQLHYEELEQAVQAALNQPAH